VCVEHSSRCLFTVDTRFIVGVVGVGVGVVVVVVVGVVVVVVVLYYILYLLSHY